MPDRQSRIAENVSTILQQIADAARRSGRDANDVQLVAVSKYVDASAMRELVAAGCTDLGESRPQALWEKATALADVPVRWHMIGHLQRNKIRRTLPICHLIHSGDSVRLLSELDVEAGRSGQLADVLVEVNISGDAEKHGFAPAEVAPALWTLSELTHVRIVGLMAMAARGTDAEQARRDFAALRELRDRLRGDCPDTVSLDHLSMGMSGDFIPAIEEGATIVRVGSALFDGIEP